MARIQHRWRFGINFEAAPDSGKPCPYSGVDHVTLRGSLEEASLADVLQLLALGRKTGLLAMESGGQAAQVFFAAGRITYATIDDRAERLGEILFKNGKITLEQRDRAVQLQSTRPGKKVGEVLVEIGAISPSQLEECVRLQIEQTVYTLFTWQRGEFIFERDITPDAQDVVVSMDPEGLLLEGARRTDEWSIIERKIPSMDLVFSVDRDRLESSGLELTEHQKRLIPLLDGTRDISTLVEETGLVEFEVGKSVYGLITTGMAWSVGRTSGQMQADGSHVEREQHRVSSETARKDHMTVAQLINYMGKKAEFQTLEKRRKAALHIVDCPQCAKRLTGVHRRRSSKLPAEMSPKDQRSARRDLDATVPAPVAKVVPKKRPAHATPAKKTVEGRAERRRAERRVMERRWTGDRRSADQADAVERRIAPRRFVADRRQGERRAQQQVAVSATPTSAKPSQTRAARPERSAPAHSQRLTVAGRTKGRRSERVTQAPKTKRPPVPSTSKPKKPKPKKPTPKKPAPDVVVSRDLTPKKEEKARPSEQLPAPAKTPKKKEEKARPAEPLPPPAKTPKKKEEKSRPSEQLPAPAKTPKKKEEKARPAEPLPKAVAQLPEAEEETTGLPAAGRRRSSPKRLSELLGRKRIDAPIAGTATETQAPPPRWPTRTAIAALTIGAVGATGWIALRVLQGGSDSPEVLGGSAAVALLPTATPVNVDSVAIDSASVATLAVAEDTTPVFEAPPPTRSVTPPAVAAPVAVEQPPARVEPQPEPVAVDTAPTPLPTHGHIAGTVRRAESDQPVVGAVVSIDSLGRSATTDAGGAFSFTDLEPGTVGIAVTGSGLLATTEAIDVTVGETVEVTIALRGPPTALSPDTVLAGEQWSESSLEDAESRLGRPIPVIEGLWIESFAEPSSGTRPRVRVAQLTETGERIVLVVARSGPAVRPPNPRLTALRVMPASAAFPVTTGSASYGGLMVSATTSLPADELKSLLVGLAELMDEEGN